ncbi:MAG: hypothetical protein N4R12_00350 [Lactobacillus crispatus]|nr:hypothetical protein [Lactobacillus crispatus]
MEPLKKSNNVNASHGTGTPVVNKPGQVNRPSFKTNKAKKQVFGSPKKPKKNNKKKNKGGMPLPLKIGGGVAAGALAVGIIGYAMTNNHANNSASNKDNSTDSDLTGKGSDDGTNDLTKNKKKNSNNKKSKKSKKDGKETDLLNDILDGEGAKASGKHSSSKSSSSEELDSLIKSMGSDSKGSHKGGASLKQLAKKATESKAVAENLGGSKSSKISEKEKSRNEIGTEKKNTSELQQLANKNKNAKSVSSEPKIPGQSNITKGTTTNSKNTTHHNISTGTKGQPTTAPGHGHHGGGTQSTTAPTPTLPYENVPDGTTKTVQFVDSDGKVVGTGELTKHGNGVSLNDIPSGYKLADEDANGKSAQLLQWPNQISVVSDGSQPTTKYPSDSVPDGTTKSIQFVDSNGKVVGTGELTKHGNGVSLNGIPSGYKLSDEDANGKSAQLLQWQNQIKVVSDGSQPATPTYLFEKVADGSSKPVTFVDSQGKSVGTGTITKEKNSVNINDIPDGYKLADLDSNGQSPQLLQWPDQISVVSDGSQSSQPTTPTYPFEKVADGSSKSVTFVDSQGKNVGTGSITRNGNGVNVSGIPGGYKLADEDSQGQSAQLLQWPNQISVVSDGSKSATPSYPAQSITNGTSKSVKFIDDSGKVVGTGTISKNGDSINVDGIPGGYELSDEGSQGQSAQLLQWPDQLSVVATGGAPSTNQSTGNSEGQLINGDASKTYPFEKVANGTTKDVSFVDSNGKVVGTGKLYKSNNSVSIDGIPGGYKLSDEDSQGQSAQLLDWPNKIVVVADGSSKPTTTYAAENIPDGTSKSVKYVDMNGNVLGTGTITKHGNGVSADGIPYGYKVAGAEGNQMNDLLNWSDQITLMPANSAIA